MVAQTNRPATADQRMIIAHQGVIERLGDPYLTEHDRWVLRQFAQFLSGVAPEPDPRARRTKPQQVLDSRVRRAAPQR